MSLTSRSGAHLSVTRDDDVVPGHAPLISIFSARAAVIDLAPAGDDGYRERLIAAGRLSPGARSMPLVDAIDQYNEANALQPGDADYLQPPAPVSLADAVDLIPEAWHDEIAADAASQGCTVSYTAVASGLRTETIHRIQRALAKRVDEPAWQTLSEGQRLDLLFPQYRGIGAWELLDELGVATVYNSDA